MYRGERQIQRYTRLLSTRTRHKYAIASAKLFPILLFSRETANQRTVQSVAQVIGSVACSHEVRLVSARVRRSWNRSVSPSRFLSRWQQSPFQRIPSGCVANARSDIVSSGLGANLENNGWKDRWISMIQIPLPYINRCIVLGGTWCRKSLRAPDVIGIYWAENWDALSPLELRLPSFLPSTNLLFHRYRHLRLYAIPSSFSLPPSSAFTRIQTSLYEGIVHIFLPIG